MPLQIQNRSQAPFLRLPDEILEEIISEIDLHQDLVSLALVSRACTGMVLPQHTEYRVIRVRFTMPNVWAHLARRSDLARNVREVHLCEHRDYSSPDHFPNTLIDHKIDQRVEYKREEIRMWHLSQALGHMKRLNVFTWDYRWDLTWAVRPNWVLEDLVLRSVFRNSSLKHLALLGKFGKHSLGGKSPDGSNYPLWDATNLHSLCFLGDACVKPANGTDVCRMLERSPDLEYLEVPMEFTRLSTCHLPHLKRLKLPLLSGAIVSIDQTRSMFISNHPTLEELSWFPIGPVEFSSNALPSIKRLRSGRQVIEALEQANIPRCFEYLDIRSLDSHSLGQLRNVDRTTLRALKLHNIGPLKSVHYLAEIFPIIAYLWMPPVHLPQDALYPCSIKLEDWLDTLSRFPNLEVFRGEGIWTAVNSEKEAMHEAILELVKLCPKLRELDHCDYDEKRRDWKRIVILREGLDGENVRYEVHKPQPWRHFDGLFSNGRFKM